MKTSLPNVYSTFHLLVYIRVIVDSETLRHVNCWWSKINFTSLIVPSLFIFTTEVNL